MRPTAAHLSPSWPQYVSNATTALQNGYTSIGSLATDPSAYQAIGGGVSPLDMFYTDFNSWLAVASPNPVYTTLPPVFQGEMGNNVHFGLHATSDGSSTFALQDLSWQLQSTDSTTWFNSQGDFSSANYSPTRVGINYGTDGIRGTADDQIYNNNEAGNIQIHELVYVGVGDGFAAYTGDGVNNQDSISDNIRDLLATAAGTAFDLRATYTLNDPLGGTPLSASQGVGISVLPGMGGDFDFNRQITSYDKDLLTQAIVAGTNDILYDLNLDTEVNFNDLERMVHEIAGTYFGDANCDGEFNSGDLIQVMVAGLYETGQPAVWSSGDFNADGIFESGDLVLALADGGYELGPMPAIAAVPEPSTLALTFVGVLLMVIRAFRR